MLKRQRISATALDLVPLALSAAGTAIALLFGRYTGTAVLDNHILFGVMAGIPFVTGFWMYLRVLPRIPSVVRLSTREEFALAGLSPGQALFFCLARPLQLLASPVPLFALSLMEFGFLRILLHPWKFIRYPVAPPIPPIDTDGTACTFYVPYIETADIFPVESFLIALQGLAFFVIMAAGITSLITYACMKHSTFAGFRIRALLYVIGITALTTALDRMFVSRGGPWNHVDERLIQFTIVIVAVAIVLLPICLFRLWKRYYDFD